MVNVINNILGEVTEVHIEKVPNVEKQKGLLHWVSADDSIVAETRVYDYLFDAYDPNELDDYIAGLNKNSK